MSEKTAQHLGIACDVGVVQQRQYAVAARSARHGQDALHGGVGKHGVHVGRTLRVGAGEVAVARTQVRRLAHLEAQRLQALGGDVVGRPFVDGARWVDHGNGVARLQPARPHRGRPRGRRRGASGQGHAGRNRRSCGCSAGKKLATVRVHGLHFRWAFSRCAATGAARVRGRRGQSATTRWGYPQSRRAAWPAAGSRARPPARALSAPLARCWACSAGCDSSVISSKPLPMSASAPAGDSSVTSTAMPKLWMLPRSGLAKYSCCGRAGHVEPDRFLHTLRAQRVQHQDAPARALRLQPVGRRLQPPARLRGAARRSRAGPYRQRPAKLLRPA
jgi:hypothetical protein